MDRRQAQASSIVGGALPRASMSVRRNPNGSSSRDPRPIGDKLYEKHCVRNVVDFLSMRGFGRTITYEKFLKEPMTKDYFEIFKFLMAQLDPQLQMEGRIEEEIPLIMKRLKYPSEIAKSKLQSICGPNTWPQLLAVLDWLIALIQVNEALIEPVAECKIGIADAELENESDHHMLRTLHENYLQFLSGKDDNSVEERLRQIYEERINAVQYEVDRLQEQMTGMDNQIHEYRSEHERLLETQAAPRQLEIEADRLRGVIQSQDARAQRAEEECATVEAEDHTVLADIETLVAKSGELQEQVNAQSYSKQDIERLKAERSHLRQMLTGLKDDAEKAEQNVWELGMEESRLEESISRSIRYINDKAEAVESVVEAVDGPSGKELMIQVDLGEPTSALAAVDFSDVSSRVETAVEAHGELTRQEEAASHDLLDEQRAAQEELSEKDREIRRSKTRLEQLTRMREEFRVWAEGQVDDARLMADHAEDAVRTAALGTAAPTVRDVAEVDDLRLLLADANSRRETDRAAMEEKLQREQESRAQLEQNTQKEMQLALQSMEQIREEVENRVAEIGGA